MRRFVYNPRYVRILLSMIDKESHIKELARKEDLHEGHLRTVIDQWQKEGILTKDKPGRSYKINLTAKGKAIALKFAEIVELDLNWEKKKNEVDKHESNKTTTNTVQSGQAEAEN